MSDAIVSDFDSVMSGLLRGYDGFEMSDGSSLVCTDQLFDESAYSQLQLPLLSIVEGPFTSGVLNSWLYAVSWTLPATLLVHCDYGNRGGQQIRQALTDLHKATMMIGGLPVDHTGTVVRYGPDTAYRLDENELTFLVDRGGPTIASGVVTRFADKPVARITMQVKCDFAMSVDQRTLYWIQQIVLGMTPLDPARLYVSPTWQPSDSPSTTIARIPVVSTSPLERGPGETPLDANIDLPNVTEEATPTALVSIAVTPSTVALAAPGTQQLAAVALFDDGTQSDVTAFVSWLSTVPAAATVSAAGLVTGVGAGSTVITATWRSVESNECAVTVS